MTTSVNPTLTAAETIFKNLIWTPMIAAGELWIEGLDPILANPILKDVDDEVILLVTNAIFNQLILFIDVTSLVLIDAAHQAAYETASVNLIAVAEQNGLNSQEYINAQNAALAALSTFTHFNA